MTARRTQLVLAGALLAAVALAAALPALAARRGAYVYDGFEMGFERACRDGVAIFINYVEPSTRILGDLTRSGARVLDQAYTLTPDPSRPGYNTVSAEARWTTPLLPGDRVQLIERRAGAGGLFSDLDRGYVVVADCLLADATGGVYLYGPGSMVDIPDALAGGPPQILYLYGQASAVNTAYSQLLSQLGFAVEARTLSEAAGLSSGALNSGYDHVVVADDTGALESGAAVWGGASGLTSALGNTTTSITGIGVGGYALFNAIGTSIAANPQPISRPTATVNVVRSTFGAPDVWPQGNQFTTAALYTGAAEVVAGTGQPAIVQKRVAELPPLAGDPSALVAVAGEPDGGRCLSHWGFRAPPDQLTGLGKSVLGRIVAETACTARAAGARTSDSALSVDDAISIARARVYLCINHPAASRLEILLLAPDGRVVELVGATSGVAGGFGQDGVVTGCDALSAYEQNAAFSDDSGYALAAGASPFRELAFQTTGALKLDTLRGSAAGGVWVLRVRDVAAGPAALTGTFPDWALELEADPKPYKVRLPEVRR